MSGESLYIMWGGDTYPNTPQDEPGQSPLSDRIDARLGAKFDVRGNTRSLWG